MAKSERATSLLDRMVMRAIGEESFLGLDSDEVKDICPEVWRWLTQTSAGREHTMEPARISIALVPGGVMATLTHRGLNQSIDACCATLHEVYKALETALTSPNPALRSFAKGQIKIRKKPKA